LNTCTAEQRVSVQNRNRGQRILELDALRGIASVFVVFFHYSGFAGYDMRFLNAGLTGVDLFFLISGYVIFMTLEKINTGTDFVISRLSRVYPSYLVMMSITIICIIFLGHESFPSLKGLIGNISLFQPFFKVAYIEDAYWTLTVEMQFYILMWILFMTGKLKQIELWGIIFVLLIQLYELIARNYLPNSKFYIIPRSYFPIISHFQMFLAGIIFFKIRKFSNRWQQHFLILICFGASIMLYPDSGKAHFFISQGLYSLMLLAYFSTFYLFAFHKLQWIAVRPLLFFGTISYCLYLIHDKAGYLIFSFLKSHSQLNLLLLTVVVFGLMVGIAALVTYYIEIPAITFIRRNLSPRLRSHITQVNLK
jgi:peptidoglycan/LPS O-acetylase OafA/YrhL